MYLGQIEGTVVATQRVEGLSGAKFLLVQPLDEDRKPNGPKEATDELWQEVIGAYIKRMSKAADEYRKTGEQGAEKLAELEFEINYLKPFLPAQIEGAELEAIVKEAIAKTGASSMKEMGNVMSALKDQAGSKIDMKLASQMVREIISKQSD